MRYGLVCYRDHPPEDTSYATKVFPLTPSIRKMQEYVDSMSAQGGGDGPESVACALNEALNSDWRKSAVKVCVIIADAPPHGIGNYGDGFPNGCPCGHDPLKTARKMAENNIIIYSVAVEPNLGNYQNGRAFYKGIAQITSGRYLGLGQAHLLPDVIIGGSAEELDLKKIEAEVETEYNKVKAEAPTLSHDALEDLVSHNLASKGVTAYHLDVTEQDDVIPGESIFYEADCLESAKSKLSSVKPTPASSSSSTSTSIFPSLTMPAFLSGIFGSSPAPAPTVSSSPMYATECDDMSYVSPMCDTSESMPATKSYSNQSATYYRSAVSKEQVSKVMKRKK